MKPNMVEKDELLLMLKDIYSQLEELELVLEESLTNIREEMHDQQAEQLLTCSGKLESIEERSGNWEEVKEKAVPKVLKYKLGYR